LFPHRQIGEEAMTTTAELSEDIRAARTRLSRMRQAVEELDRRIGDLERRQNAAEPRDRAGIGLEIRTATEQRLSALELLTEAEAQLAEREQRFGEAVNAGRKQLSATAQTCADAAGRFDRAMREAVAALAEIETVADPIRPFLPSGIGSYTHMRHVSAAFRYAFADRLSHAELAERKSMSERIGQMIADARHNSVEQRDGRAA
jgi:chromosome segregation ATPase